MRRKPDTPSTITFTETPRSAASISAPRIIFPLSSALKSNVDNTISDLALLIIFTLSRSASPLSSIIRALSGWVLVFHILSTASSSLSSCVNTGCLWYVISAQATIATTRITTASNNTSNVFIVLTTIFLAVLLLLCLLFIVFLSISGVLCNIGLWYSLCFTCVFIFLYSQLALY